jgi:predicted acyltransferase
MSRSSRLISLDALRGLTIAAMIVVNSPGSWEHIYAPFEHKPWNGITPTDLIFPFFLFIVGVSVVLAYGRGLKPGTTRKDAVRKILWRALKIFVVGLLLNLYPYFNFEELRVAGVLQRIAIVFAMCGLAFLYLDFTRQVVLGTVLLIGYWVAMTLIPTPGYAQPMLEPGANLAAWVDSWLLPGRMWQHTWDPEGLFSTIPAIATGISGMIAGKLLISAHTLEKKIKLLLLGGLISLAVGYLWSVHFPLNKNLWSSSYVLVTSGYAAIVLSIFMFLIDKEGNEKFARPFVIFGSNAITVYVLAWVAAFLFDSVIMGESSIQAHFMNLLTNHGFEPKLASLAYAFLYIALMYVPAWLLYRKKIFIKL